MEEPGMLKQTAIPIDLSNDFEGRITETRYTWYKTELDANQTYNWYKKGGEYLYFYPEGSTTYEYKASFNTVFSFTPSTTGTYYLKIIGTPGLTWSLDLVEEPGMLKQTAIPIDLSNGFEGTITETRYTWYKTELDANQTYISKKSGGDHLYFYSEGSTTYEYKASYSTIFDFTPSTTGTYYLKIVGTPGLTWSLTPTDPGTTRGTALEANLNSDFEGTITNQGYTWYSTELDASQTYSFEKIGGESVSIYPENETTSIYTSDSSMEFSPPHSGTYYIKVTGEKGSTWSLLSATFGSKLLNQYYSGANPEYHDFYGKLTGNFDNDEAYPYVSPRVALGGDAEGFVALPTGSYITIGFSNEVIDLPNSPDVFIKEDSPAGDQAEIYVSSYDNEFVFLGIAEGGTTTSFDLADIGFDQPVVAVAVVGLDMAGASPGFDLVHVSGITNGKAANIPFGLGFYLPKPLNPTPISGSEAKKQIERIDYYAFADTRSYHADPVDTSSGAMVINKNLLQLHGPQKLNFKLAYHSLLLNEGVVGIGWSHNYDAYLEQESEYSVVIRWSNHQKNRFIKNEDGTYDSYDKATQFDELTQQEDGSYTLKRKDQRIYQFDASGKLVELINKHGKSITFQYDESTHQLIKVIEEDTGTFFSFEYTGNLLTKVTDNLARTVHLQYDENNHLTQITNARDEVITYTYDEQGRVLTSTEQGVQTFVNTYDESGRVITQDDGVEGNAITTFQYDEEIEPGYLTTIVTKRDGQTKKLIHDYQYRLVKVEDELGHITTMEYDGLGNLIKETNALNQTKQFGYDEMGNTIEIIDQAENMTLMTYDERNNLLTRTNAVQQKTEFTYDESNRLIQVTNPEGFQQYFTYDELGYVQSNVNFNEAETLFTNTNGMLQEKQDPNGNIVKYEYDEVGRLTKESFSETEAITYAYDALDHLIQQTDQLGNTTQFAYDMQGNLLSETNALEETTTYTYNANGKLVSVEDRLGNTISYAYDAEDRLQKITDPMGHETVQSYDAKGRVFQITDPMGHVTTKEYNAIDQLISETDAEGNREEFTYDTLGYLSAKTDKNGSITSMTHNAMGQLIQVTDALEGTSTFTVDSSGNITKEVDALGKETVFTYDGMGNVLTKTDALGNVTSYTNDRNGNLVSETDAENQSTQYTYNHLDQLTKTTDAKGNIIENTYDAKGRILSTTDQLGNTVTFSYDALDRLVSTTDEIGNSETYTYDKMDRLVSTIDPEGNISTFTYDALGNLLSETNALNGVTQFTYDQKSNMIIKTDAAGNVTTYTYNKINALIQEADALGQVTQYAYDKEGRLTNVTDPSGNTMITTYDAMGRQTGMTDPLGNTFTTQYDAVGNLISQKDAKDNQITSIVYNDSYQPIQTTDALGNTTTQAYDKNGRLTTLTDPLENVQTYQYDAVNQLVQVVDAMGGISQQSFDSKGQLLAFTDANGVETSFEYDAAGRLIKETFDSGGGITYQYDGRDLLIEKKNVREQVTTYAYDEVGRFIKTNTPESEVSRTYDDNHNLLTVTDQDGKTITRTYDALDRIVSYVDENGNKIEYRYDEVGNLSQLIYPDGKIVSYTYDEAGKLKSVTDWAGRVTLYTYDENNRLIFTVRPDGSKETRTYDVAGQLIELKDETKDGDIIHQETFTYDASSNVKTEGNKNYLYDELNRLTQADNFLNPLDQSSVNYQYAYDIGGNIQTIQEINDLSTQETSITYTSDNRIETYDGETVLYDADGNMIQGPLQGVMQQMEYDSQNHLIRAGDYTYTYNAEDIRTSITNTSTDETVYQVVNPHAVYSQLLMEVDEEGNPLTYYVYGLGLISQEEATGEVSLYHYDRRGSTFALTNIDGDITDKYGYSPYGELIYSEGTRNHPFLYNGRYGVMTDENGLYYMRARYYNPEIKRFINRDVVQGSISSSLSLNKYAYVNGNPISYIDPFGLSRDSDDVGFFGKAWNLTKTTADFLVLEDARTLIDSDASFTAKVIAGASLFPAGKVLKLGKLFGKATSGVKATKESSNLSKVVKHNEAPNSLPYPMAGDNIGIQLGKSTKGPYSHIPDPKTVGEGKNFTAAQKHKIIQENMKTNNGVVKSDFSGEICCKPKKSQKGVTPPQNEWQIDHIFPRDKGGTNSYSNAQVLTRKENRDKSNK
ncbi:RHS repeat-associated core domain-containing protein [Chengkuizengella sediminis]|uniref:RHS repeat-associated core domain-containing protein n=1 Tax=Chengkuizengella sediminis TaxID=1885917 RepID=UPI00196A534C